MRTQIRVFVAIGLTGLPAASPVGAQQPQIPTLQVCNQSVAKGTGRIEIQSRKDATPSSGSFEINISVKCPDANGYPSGLLEIKALSMSDSQLQGLVKGVTFEQMTATGKHTPTLYLSGRCEAAGVRGCRYWLMIADNRKAGDTQGTPDVVSLLVLNANGGRVTHGTGPIVSGDIVVPATVN